MGCSFKKAEAKLELLTDIDMLLMVENGIRVGICYLYAESNNTKNDDSNKKALNLMC